MEILHEDLKTAACPYMDVDVTFSKTKRTLTRSLKKSPVQRAVLSLFLSLQLSILSFFIFLNYCRTKLFGYLYIMPRTCVVMFCENGCKTGHNLKNVTPQENGDKVGQKLLRYLVPFRLYFWNIHTYIHT